MEVNRDGKETFHEQLRVILLDSIKNGTLRPGQKIPSERELSEIYNVSRTTAKAAVLQLAQEGIVVRATGKGTFVSSDLHAEKLNQQRTRNVAFVLNKLHPNRVPLPEDAVYLAISQGIQGEITPNGFHLMTTTVDEDDVAELESFKSLLKKVDGVVIAEARSARLFELAHTARIPVVLSSPASELEGVDIIDVENEQCGFVATQYLLGLGHERIACVRGPQHHAAARLRFQGYCRALESAGLAVVDDLVVPSETWMIEDGEASYGRLRGAEARFTALVGGNDLLALGALRAARAAGTSVPDQLSIIGCDNIGLTVHSEPPLTTLESHVYSIGRAAARRLIERIEGDDLPPQRLLFPATLVERQSCGAPARAQTERAQQ
jgi:LacI family transcriptional regulator